jgi:hypothetical protein
MEFVMSITFRSEAQASVEMLEHNAKELLEILGKFPSDARGVFAVEQIPGAIGTLKALIAARASQRKIHAMAEIDVKAGEVFEVDISLRAMPLLELLENALKAKKPVTWGV